MLEDDLLLAQIPDDEISVKGAAQQNVGKLRVWLQDEDLVLVPAEVPDQSAGVRVPQLDGRVRAGRDYDRVVDVPCKHEDLDLGGRSLTSWLLCLAVGGGGSRGRLGSRGGGSSGCWA